MSHPFTPVPAWVSVLLLLAGSQLQAEQFLLRNEDVVSWEIRAIAPALQGQPSKTTFSSPSGRHSLQPLPESGFRLQAGASLRITASLEQGQADWVLAMRPEGAASAWLRMPFKLAAPAAARLDEDPLELILGKTGQVFNAERTVLLSQPADAELAQRLGASGSSLDAQSSPAPAAALEAPKRPERAAAMRARAVIQEMELDETEGAAMTVAQERLNLAIIKDHPLLGGGQQGIKARRAFATDERIAKYRGSVIGKYQYDRSGYTAATWATKKQQQYIMEVSELSFIDGYNQGRPCLAALANYAPRHKDVAGRGANAAFFKTERNEIELCALEPIAVGEEILADYGPDIGSLIQALPGYMALGPNSHREPLAQPSAATHAAWGQGSGGGEIRSTSAAAASQRSQPGAGSHFERAPSLPDKYEVERIVGETSIFGELHYRVRWKGYGAHADTWQPAAQLLEEVPSVVATYKSAKTPIRRAN